VTKSMMLELLSMLVVCFKLIIPNTDMQKL